MTDRELMQMALDALDLAHPRFGAATYNHNKAIKSLRERLAQPEPEPIKWFPAPIKTHWVANIVQADLEIDNNHTLSIYCESDQTKKVEEMLNMKPKREWVDLTDEAIWLEYQQFWPFHPAEEPTLAKDIAKFARAIEAKLKEKNA